MAGEKATLYISGFGPSDSIDTVEVAASALSVSHSLNEAARTNREFVHFKLAAGGSIAIRPERVRHIAELPDQ